MFRFIGRCRSEKEIKGEGRPLSCDKKRLELLRVNAINLLKIGIFAYEIFYVLLTILFQREYQDSLFGMLQRILIDADCVKVSIRLNFCRKVLL